MNKVLSRIYLSIVAVAALSSFAFAQQSTLSGVVTDSNGAAIAGASVTLANQATAQTITSSTNDGGRYNFLSVQPGTYKLSIEASGFTAIDFENLVVETASKVVRDVRMEVRTLDTTVVINDEGVKVNNTDASVGTVINRRFVENIPLNGRSFQSLLTIVPGVTAVASSGTGSSGGISVNGQRTEANYFTVDGVSANTGLPPTGTPGFGAGFAGATAGETALGTTHSLLSIDALQEFKTGTSSYSAEFGRSPGGQFSFTSRSGTNRYSGSLYTYFRNDVFDAANFFTNATRTVKPATRQFNFGGTFGGPLPFLNFGETDDWWSSGKDRTFFFVSYEGLRLRTPSAGVTTYVPDNVLRGRTTVPGQTAAAAWLPLLNAFPVANGPSVGNGLATFTSGYSNPSEIDSIGVRIDHRFSDRFSIFGRYSDTPSNSSNRLLTNLAQQQTNEFGNRSITIGSTQIFSTSIVNDLRVSYTDVHSRSVFETTDFGGAVPYNIPDIPTVNTSLDNRINVAFQFGPALNRPVFSLLNQTGDQNQWNFVDTLSVAAGDHSLKFGVDYRRTETALTLPPRFMPINVAAHTQFINNSMGNFNLVIYSLDRLRPIYENFSLFAQDEWRVNRRMSISAGLRYEINPAPTDAANQLPYNLNQTDNLATAVLVMDRSKPLWKTTYNNFAPRLGVAYTLRDNDGWETVIRAGGGVYYDLGNTQASDGYGRAGFRRTATFVGSPFPLTAAQVNNIPAPSVTTPYTETVLTDDLNLKLPFTIQWNGAIEQSLGREQSFSVSYVGASGQRLLVDRSYLPRALGNLNFSANAAIVLTTNEGRSSYHALQAQFQRRLAKGFQAHASYTWAHAIDNATSNFTVRQLTRGNADFDIRHNFQSALSYDIPFNSENSFISAFIKDWALDGRVSARTALPVNIIGRTGVDPSVPYLSLDFQPNYVAGQPLYVDDPTVAGGRRINFAAFSAAGTAQSPTQGNLGRNLVRGFGSFQTDLALRRNFSVTETVRIQFRGEVFNVFNRANFGAIQNGLSSGSANFGIATNTQNQQLGGLNSLYQVGGPRSFQFALKLLF